MGRAGNPDDDSEPRARREAERGGSREAATSAASAGDASFRAIFEATLDALLVTDDAGVIVDANPAATELLGRPKGALVGEPLSRFVPADDGVSIPKGSARAQHHVVRADGDVRTVESSRGATLLPGRRLTVLRDVTERSRSETALRQQDKLFRAIIEHGSEIVLLLDHKARIAYGSPSFTQKLGYPVSDWLGREVFALVPPEDLARLRERFAGALAEPGVMRQTTMRLRRADGTHGTYEARGVNRLADPDIRSIVVNLRDVTESHEASRARDRLLMELERELAQRHKAEQALDETAAQLRHAQKMDALGSLAGGIAHDFNNLLSIILGYVDMILSDFEGGPAAIEIDDVKPDLEQVRGAAVRATELTRQLLAFSRRQVLEPRAVDMNLLVGGLEQMIQRLLGASVELSARYGPGLGTVRIDPGQLEQVLLNLAANARDAMPEGGTLVIETTNARVDASEAERCRIAAGRYVRITVSDTGNGMDAATLERVFEPFFTTKERGKGTGLGLAMVFGIVRQSGGHVSVTSDVGRGTVVSVLLPRTDAPAETLHPPPPAPRSALFGKETVLLVEDDERVRGLMRNMLRRLGYRVLESGSPGEAILTCEQHKGPIDLMLTDVVMPKLSGRALAERLQPIRPEMRVVFMSGYPDDAMQENLAGVAFLQKPVNADTLARKLRQVLDDAS